MADSDTINDLLNERFGVSSSVRDLVQFEQGVMSFLKEMQRLQFDKELRDLVIEYYKHRVDSRFSKSSAWSTDLFDIAQIVVMLAQRVPDPEDSQS